MLFRTFAIAILLCVTAVPFFAQWTAAFEEKHNIAVHYVPEPMLQTAKAALNLSDVQLTAVKALLDMRSQTNQQIHQEVEAAHRKLEELTAQDTSNPTEIGAAFLAARSVENRMREANEKFRTDFRALLSADQRSTLARFNAFSDQLEALRHLGVLDSSNPHESGIHFSMPAMHRSIVIERHEAGRQ